MSDNPAFLSPAPLSAQDRDEAKGNQRRRAQGARTAYRWANILVITAMALVVVPPLASAGWLWYMAGGIAMAVTALAIVMVAKGSVWNGLISLVFAWALLPLWVKFSPQIIQTGGEKIQVLVQDWLRSVLPDAP